jgi:hypothetical protein
MRESDDDDGNGVCVGWEGKEGVVPSGRSQSEPQKIRYPTLAAVVHAQYKLPAQPDAVTQQQKNGARLLCTHPERY